MIDTEALFRYKTPNFKKLEKHGFSVANGAFVKDFGIMSGQFVMTVSVFENGDVSYKVTDTEYKDEYDLVNAQGAVGAFVSLVRESCKNILCEIADRCFDTEMMKSGQTKRLISHIYDAIGVAPEFPWDSYPEAAVFRREDNKKWFALIMKIKRSAIGLVGEDSIEIVNLKADAAEVEMLLKKEGIHPAYHMNKKYWFTIRLDGSLSDEEIFSLVEASFEAVAAKKRGRKAL